MAARAIPVFLISVLFLSNTFFYTTATAPKPDDSDIDEDLKFLEEDSSASDLHQFGGADLGDFDNYDDLGEEGADSDEDSYSPPIVDEKDVVVLKNSNFTDFIASNPYVMVEFYAPWCGHCQALAPEFAAAATELKGEVVLAKVDAAEESDLAQKYDVQGYPTIFFFIDGVHKDYSGQRDKDSIVSWVKKKTGPGIHNITTIEEAERVLKSEVKIVLGFIDSLVGTQSEELSFASKIEEDVNFYQTDSPDIAKLFHIDPQAKRPALVMIKKEAEQISHFDGDFSKSVIANFVFENKFPLVITFTREIAPQIFENPIKKQLLLFAASNESEKLLPNFQEAAKAFKGKLIFVYVELDNEDVGKPIADYFGVSGDSPKVLAYTGNEDGRKFVLDGELTLQSVKSFGDDFLEEKLKPFFKSEPIPENNDEDVKIVVGQNFDEIVLDESKDVLLEIYAPWCGHCQSLEPIYNKLAKHLKGINSLVIAKMDGTTNEHPRAKPDGFPTLVFFPAGNKSFEPITVDTDRTVVAFYKFIKKHAAIPFKLRKPDSTEKKDTADGYVKDEL